MGHRHRWSELCVDCRTSLVASPAARRRYKRRHPHCSVEASGSVSRSLWDTTMQAASPPAVLARVSSYDLTTSFALLPIGYALVGPVSVALGIQRTFLLAVAIVLFAVLAVLMLPSVTRPRPDDKTSTS